MPNGDGVQELLLSPYRVLDLTGQGGLLCGKILADLGADGTVDISPSARFCIKESEIITALYKGIEQLKAAEDGEGGEGAE